ncbi:MAG: MATE family efflux transporter [Candidatus Velthaea sp.]
MIAGHRDVRATLVRLAAPVAAALAGDQLLGIVDTIVIGHFGADALAAITGATTIFVAVALAMHGVVQGAGILCAQAIGANDLRAFGRIARSALVVPLLLSLAAVTVAWWGAEPAIRSLVGPLPTVAAGGAYLFLRIGSLVPIAFSAVAYTIFTAAGDTRFAFKLLLIINAVHIPLLLVLALGLGTQHPLGIEGAGISSLVSELVGAGYVVSRALRRPQFQFFAAPLVDWPLVLRSTLLGVPEAVYLFLVMAPDIAIVAMLAPLGAETVAAFRALMIVSDLTWAIPGSLGMAAQTVIGQLFGARDPAGARDFDRRAIGYGVRLSGFTAVIVAAASWPIAAAITLSPALASIAFAPIALHMLSLPLKGYAMLGIARIRAAGDTRFSMIAGIIAAGFVIPGVYVGVTHLHMGLYAVPCAWILAWLFWCLATALRLHRFDWEATHLAV